EGFGYLLAHAKAQGLVHGISLPDEPDSQLLNGHFADDSFLTLIEDENNIDNAMQCLDTFCLASGSSIQCSHRIIFAELRGKISADRYISFELARRSTLYFGGLYSFPCLTLIDDNGSNYEFSGSDTSRRHLKKALPSGFQ
ncbi:hypothetical protein KI387_022485, partial [Taxus chinensis]